MSIIGITKVIKEKYGYSYTLVRNIINKKLSK
jgi:hypothetical protein